MFKEKLKALLHFIFVYSPLTFCVGLSIIILGNERIVQGTFVCEKIKRKRKQIDKEKFAKMMRRLCK